MLTTFTKMLSADNKMYPFYNKMYTSPVHLAFASFGKDSMATIALALDHGEPLDAVVTCREYYDRKRGIELEHPIHTRWVQEIAIPWIENNGIPVVVIESNLDFLTLFHRRITRGPNYGMMRGYPLGNKCYITRDLKMTTITKYLEAIPHPVQYVGIAADEGPRLQRLNNYNKVSLLKKYGVTQQGALELCQQKGLLSPLYEYSPRTGCWLCPNQTRRQTQFIKDTMPDLFHEWMHLADGLEDVRYKDVFPKFNNTQIELMLGV